MRVLVTGASGLVGSALVEALVARGDSVVALSRDPAAHAWPAGVEPVAWDGRAAIPARVRADAAVNLAGERIIGKRWTKALQQEMLDSRLAATRRVAEWANAQARPPAIVSTSAAGYYGDLVTGPCPETRGPGQEFLARLARDWEAEARRTTGRLVILRLGHVLTPKGGYLGTILPFVRLHAAGPIGTGRQPMPWVHIGDVVGAYLWALDHPVAGTFNVVAPGAAGGTQGEFARALAKAMRAPGQVPVPVFGLKLRFGGGAGPALAGGQDLRADAIQQAGHRFRHAELAPALADLVA